MTSVKYGEGIYDPPLDLLTRAEWPGATFSEVISPPAGSADNRVTDIMVTLTIDRLKMRRFGKRTFDNHPQYPLIHMPGDEGRGEWEGVAKSFILNLSEDLVYETIQPRGRLVRPAGVCNATKVQHLLHLIRSDSKAGCPAGAVVSEFFVSEIISTIFLNEERKSFEQSATARQIKDVRDYIEANLSQPLRLSEMASKTGMSTRHMCRAFRAATTQPPHAYILQRRVERAREIIRSSSSMTLSEIAAEVGFSSQAHMAWAFRKLLARSPSQFRNRGD